MLYLQLQDILILLHPLLQFLQSVRRFLVLLLMLFATDILFEALMGGSAELILRQCVPKDIDKMDIITDAYIIPFFRRVYISPPTCSPSQMVYFVIPTRHIKVSKYSPNLGKM